MRELPRGWVEATLGDVVFDIRNGKNVAQDKSGNGTAVSRIETIAKEVVDFDRTGFTTDLYREHDDLLKPGDVLFSHINSARHLGKTAVFPKHAKRLLHGINLLRITVATKATTPEFFHQQCRLFRQQGVFELNGQHAVNQSSINQKKLKELSFTLPPLAEQKRIVAKLDALNAKSTRARTELARIETLVSRYKQAMLSKAFSGELSRSQTRFEQFIETAGNGLSKREGDEGDWINVLRLTDLNQGQFAPEEPRQIRLTSREVDKYRLTEGDVVIIRVNGSANLVGRSFCFNASDVWAFCDHFIRIRLKSSMDPEFTAHFLNSPPIRGIIEHKFVSTSGQKTISQKTLEELPAPLIPLDEQHEIVRRIESAFAKIDRLAKEAKRALELVGRLDEAILAKAFRGELVPQDENDEPAEHMLARIRAEREAAPKGKRGRGAKG